VSVRVAAVTLAAVLATAGVALAAKPVKGGKAASQGVRITFKVSANGKRVTKLQTSNLPVYCEAGGAPTPIKFANAKISKKGKFKSTGLFRFTAGPDRGKVGARLQITGKFQKHRREAGTLTTTYTKSHDCSGAGPYSTQAG
jgi:hypothetical protein